MDDQNERAAQLLAWAMYRATMANAVGVAVVRGWMLDRGDSVCLTDAGRDLVKGR
jgi:hypothetical protein